MFSVWQVRAEPSAGWRPLSITALDGNSEEELQRRVISAVAPRWRCCKRRMPTTRDSRLVGNQEPKEYPYTGRHWVPKGRGFARFLPGDAPRACRASASAAGLAARYLAEAIPVVAPQEALSAGVDARRGRSLSIETRLTIPSCPKNSRTPSNVG